VVLLELAKKLMEPVPKPEEPSIAKSLEHILAGTYPNGDRHGKEIGWFCQEYFAKYDVAGF